MVLCKQAPFESETRMIKIFLCNLRAAACKNQELHFTDHLVEFLIFRLKITLDELFSKIIF